MSDESVNSYGFRVMTSGIDLSRFKKNPVMLMNHCEDDVPGGWSDISIEGNNLCAVTNFDEKDEEALTLANKVEQGFINGASIGFCILETSTDPQLMLPGQTRPTVTKCILHEASITPLPSNGNALALYDANGQKLKLEDAVLENCQLSLITPNTKPNTDMKLNAKTYATLSLSVDAAESAIDTAVENLSQRAITAEAALKTLKDAKAAEDDTRAETLVNKAIADKKLTADKKESWKKLALSDYASTEAALNSMGVQKKDLNANLKDEEVETGGEDRSKWTLTDYRQKDAKALEEMQLNNKDAFDKLVAAFDKNGK